jgi:hypothetical protein
MCRYGFYTYKPHFACFTCRKTFKQPNYIDLLKKKLGKDGYAQLLRKQRYGKLTEKQQAQVALVEEVKNREIKCPECGGYMVDLGYDFRSPKKTAVKEWAIIEGLYTIGKSFYSCGCNGPGYIPKEPADYAAYLKRMLRTYEGEIHACQEKTLEECPDKAEINYWSDKATLVREEIKHRGFVL